MDRRSFLRGLTGLSLISASTLAMAKTTKTTKTAKTAKTPATKSAVAPAAKKVSVKQKVAPANYAASAFPSNLKSRSVVVQEGEQRILFEKNPDERVSIASITKLMTAMVFLDGNPDFHDQISISHDDIDEVKNSRSRLPPGTVLSKEEALLLALMSSENRASHALARTAPGGLDNFIKRMNAKARNLGMADSRFVDPTGLLPGNVSTAHDLGIMIGAAAKYSKIKMFSTTEEHEFQIGSRPLHFKNSNPLVRSEDWNINLSKTGYTREAGRCLVMEARIQTAPVRIVLLDSANKEDRIADAQRIRQWLLTQNA